MMIRRNAAYIVRSRLRSSQGSQATIARGQDFCGGVTAVLGGVESIADSPGTVRFEAETQEILILATEYSPTGPATDPETGDIITVLIEGKSVRFEARIPSGSQKCFQRANSEWSELRVHCRRVDSVNADL
jgi:hypothetical protein